MSGACCFTSTSSFGKKKKTLVPTTACAEALSKLQFLEDTVTASPWMEPGFLLCNQVYGGPKSLQDQGSEKTIVSLALGRGPQRMGGANLKTTREKGAIQG